ncbi:MAG: hypothetical protein WB770_12240 [Acidimicrobiales bacterium]
MGSAKRAKLRGAGVGLVLAVVTVLFAACGNGSASPGIASVGSSTTTTSPGTEPPITASPTDFAKDVAYTQCVRFQGVPNFPDPNSQGDFLFGGPNGVNPNSWRFISANKICEHLEPNGGQQTAAETTDAIAIALKIATCMHSHGVPKFPDPTSQGNIQIRGQIDPNSPRFRVAMTACQTLFNEYGAIP